MKINLEEFTNRAEFINCQKHDTLPLLIWNYSHACQYSKAWDEYTLIARGLITDLDGNIVARPFKKFFNLGEVSETNIENLPAEVPIILEKMDGSMVITYKDGDKICGATRGSFNSEQAQWATKWLQARYTAKDFKDGYTYIFEAIYPENRIVVDYGGRKELVLLAIIDNETGLLEPHDVVVEASSNLKVKTPKVENTSRIEDLCENLKTLGNNCEGFVVRFSNGLMLKMKGEEYIRLHRLITGFSSKSIWECLMNNQNILDVIKDVPDEFYVWVMKKAGELKNAYNEKYSLAKAIRDIARDYPTRKEQAELIMRFDRTIASVVFAMLDGKDYKKIIWRMLKPKYELPFKTDEN